MSRPPVFRRPSGAIWSKSSMRALRRRSKTTKRFRPSISERRMADRHGRLQPAAKPILQIQDLQVYYGESHALQGVSLDLARGILSVVGRNGMGKTTLCNTIAGLMRARSGAIRFEGRDISRLDAHEIARLGVGLVPQGRRLWPSLTVDETLHLCFRAGVGGNAWNVERVYATFPRLAERKSNGGSQLSGGEQQMLAISRALLANPRLLVMDEPTEGLAPLIVAQVRDLLIRLANEEDLWLLGVGRHAEPDAPAPNVTSEASGGVAQVYRVVRQGGEDSDGIAEPLYRADSLPNRWGIRTGPSRAQTETPRRGAVTRDVFAIPIAERVGRTALVAGTFDTKGAELRYISDRLRDVGIQVRTVDLSTSGKISRADVSPLQVASMHPGGSNAVFSGDRGQAVGAMADAFARWIDRERDIGGIISAGGSGGTSLATAGMRRLPVG